MSIVTETIAYTPVIFGKQVFTISQFRLHSNHDKTRLILLKDDFLGLYLNLGKSFEYCGDGLLPATIKKRHYNIAFIPKGRYEVTTHKGIHRSLIIAVKRSEFEGFAKDFHFLQPLYTSEKIFKSVRPEHFLIPPQMEADIMRLLTNDNKNAFLRNVSTESSAMSIFYDALSQIRFLSMPGQKYLGYKVETIHEVADYLLNNLGQSIKIEDLVERYGITKNRLQKGFKELFDTTVHEYILEKRMNKAKEMLQDPALPIARIAYMIGYKGVQNFTMAFKKRFKQSPSGFRGKEAP
jgi:AraC-like DNA-binding protein